MKQVGRLKLLAVATIMAMGLSGCIGGSSDTSSGSEPTGGGDNPSGQISEPQDTTVPVITLLGNPLVTVVQGQTYTDTGATAFDNYDGNITTNITTVNPVDTNTIGSYTVTYDVSDAAGNAANQLIRTVIVGTGASGIINSNAIWSKENSPYLLQDKIQIAYGSTLTIEPGVEVFGNDLNIEVFGKLDAQGNQNAYVQFNGVNIAPGNNTSNVELFKIDINYAKSIGGSIYYPTGNAIYGSMNLRNSILKDLPYMYIRYPEEDCNIEKNIFINSGGISVGTSKNIIVNIKNNVFYQQTGDFAIQNWASYSTSETIVSLNSFLSTDRIALSLPKGYTSAKMTAYNNFFNSSEVSVIESMIFDKNDDLSSADYIVYSPFLESAHPDTPDISEYID